MSTWIFLRGLMREARHWGTFPERFRAVLPDAQVHALDLPGNGALHAVRSATRIAAMTEFCRADLASRRIAPPYHVLALSLGAMVAADWAARFPHDVAAAVLISTSMRPFNPFHQRLRAAHYPALLRLALSRSDPERLERWILQATSNAAAAQREALADWIRYQRECPVSTANALRQLLAAARYRAPRAAPAVPLLLLCGGGDRLVDPRCSRRLARAWRVPLAEHPSAGHDLALDDPAWLAQQIRDWLGSCACHMRAL